MAVLIKRYANRKLYNTKTSRYITLKGIADLLESGEDVRVIDNESGEDITSITLSQILVDTERSNRAVPGSVLSGLFQKGGDALYDAFSKGVDDASERLDEMQRNMRSILRGQERGETDEDGKRSDWIAFSPPDLDKLVQGTLERVFKALDLPRRSDVQELTERLEQLTDLLDKGDGGKVDGGKGDGGKVDGGKGDGGKVDGGKVDGGKVDGGKLRPKAKAPKAPAAAGDGRSGSKESD